MAEPAQPTPPPNPGLIARVLYGVMLGGPVMFAMVAIALRSASAAPLAPSPLIRYGLLGFWLVAILVLSGVRGRIPPREGAPAAWWRTYLSRVLVLWVVLEAVGLVAVVGWFLTADVLLLGLFLLGFLVPMTLLSPGRLSGE